MSEGHCFLSDEQLDRAAFAPGYPKIPNVEHDRQDIDHEALFHFMPVGEPALDMKLGAKNLYDGLKEDQLRWTASFTIPALFARVRNLEAQVLQGQRLIDDRQQEIDALVSQRNATFQSDRRSQGPYRLQIREAGSMEDRNCFGLPTVIHVQSYVPRTGHFHLTGEDEAVYEGKYALLQNHRGDVAMTSAAQAEKAVERLTEFLPGPFTEREDPAFVVGQAIDALKNRKLLLKERAETEKAIQALEPLIAGVQKALMAALNGGSHKTNLKNALSKVNTLLECVIALRGEDVIDEDSEFR